MTNKARQRSLQKKNGLTGSADYCYFCPHRKFIITSISLVVNSNNDVNFCPSGHSGCSMKTDITDECAKAFNRMIRNKRRKND